MTHLFQEIKDILTEHIRPVDGDYVDDDSIYVATGKLFEFMTINIDEAVREVRAAAERWEEKAILLQAELNALKEAHLKIWNKACKEQAHICSDVYWDEDPEAKVDINNAIKNAPIPPFKP